MPRALLLGFYIYIYSCSLSFVLCLLVPSVCLCTDNRLMSNTTVSREVKAYSSIPYCCLPLWFFFSLVPATHMIFTPFFCFLRALSFLSFVLHALFFRPPQLRLAADAFTLSPKQLRDIVIGGFKRSFFPVGNGEKRAPWALRGKFLLVIWSPFFFFFFLFSPLSFTSSQVEEYLSARPELRKQLREEIAQGNYNWVSCSFYSPLLLFSALNLLSLFFCFLISSLFFSSSVPPALSLSLSALSFSLLCFSSVFPARVWSIPPSSVLASLPWARLYNIFFCYKNYWSVSKKGARQNLGMEDQVSQQRKRVTGEHIFFFFFLSFVNATDNPPHDFIPFNAILYEKSTFAFTMYIAVVWHMLDCGRRAHRASTRTTGRQEDKKKNRPEKH